MVSTSSNYCLRHLLIHIGHQVLGDTFILTLHYANIIIFVANTLIHHLCHPPLEHPQTTLTFIDSSTNSRFIIETFFIFFPFLPQGFIQQQFTHHPYVLTFESLIFTLPYC